MLTLCQGYDSANATSNPTKAIPSVRSKRMMFSNDSTVRAVEMWRIGVGRSWAAGQFENLRGPAYPSVM